MGGGAITMGVAASVAVAIGGAGGSLARFWVTNFFLTTAPGFFPFGTLVINVVGAFAIGIAAVALVELPDVPAWLRFGLLAGVLGGFTTVSGFSLDFWILWNRGETVVAAIYAIATVALSLAAAGAGLVLARHVFASG